MRLLVFILMFTSTLTFGQGSGYYGRKFHFTVSSDLQTPLMFNMITKHADRPKWSNDLSKKQQDLFNYSINTSIGYAFRKRLMMSTEVGVEFSDFYLDDSNTLPNWGGYVFKFQKMGLRTYSFMPVLEISGKNSLLPLGLSHEIGLGLSRSKLVRKNYNVQARIDNSYYVNLNPSYIHDHLFDFENQKSFNFVTLMYGLNMRTAIAKRVLFNYGFRYIFRFKLNNTYSTKSDFILDQNEIQGDVYDQQIRRILRFKIGLSLIL